jgi:hypothetical protein
VKLTALDGPPDVVITTGTVFEPPIGGTVTVHVVWDGQLVAVTCPPNVAMIWPSALEKLEPATWSDCPALPLWELSDEITGAPAPAPAGPGVMVVVAPAPAPCRGGGAWCVAGLTTTARPPGTAGESVPTANETPSAADAAATRTAAAPTAHVSRRSGSGEDGCARHAADARRGGAVCGLPCVGL